MFINISLVFFLGCLLGLVWYHFGVFLEALGNLLEPVGTLWGAPMEPFGALWTTLGAPGQDFGASRGPFGVHLGSGWGVFGVILDVKLRE